MRTGPARAGLSFLSLMLGLFSVTLLLSTLDGLRRESRELVRQFGAGAFVLVKSRVGDGSRWKRTDVDLFRQNLEETAWVSGIRTVTLPPGGDMMVVATDSFLAKARDWHIVEGRAIDFLDVRHGFRHVVIPAPLARENQWRTGQIILLGREPYRVAGVYDSGEGGVPTVPAQAVFIPYTADRLEANEEEALRRVDAILFNARTGMTPEALQRRVRALLSQPEMGEVGVEWITLDSLLAGIRRWQRAIVWTAGSGGALSLVLGAVTLAGMLLTGVRERIPEIGLRRALGARRSEVAGLFVAEALLLSGVAAVAGTLAAEVFLRCWAGRFPLPFHLGWGTRLVPLGMAWGIGLLCSAGPAWFAARMPPAEALRND